MAILLGQPVSNDGLNKGLAAWYYPIGNPYSGFTTWTDLARKKQATVTAGVTWGMSSSTGTAPVPLTYFAARFTAGSSHYASCPIPTGLHGATCASISFFVCTPGGASPRFPLATGTTDDYWEYAGSGYVGVLRSARVDVIPITKDSRDWTHFGITTDGTNWVMYQDGLQIHAVAAEATVTASKLEIAKNGSGTFWDTYCNSLRVWVGHALSAADMKLEYLAAKQGYTQQLNRTKPGFITSVAAPAGLAANPLYGGGAAANPLWGYVA